MIAFVMVFDNLRFRRAYRRLWRIELLTNDEVQRLVGIFAACNEM
jgi:hypothetical protein